MANSAGRRAAIAAFSSAIDRVASSSQQAETAEAAIAFVAPGEALAVFEASLPEHRPWARESRRRLALARREQSASAISPDSTA
jgi:hypothetical protein